MKKLYFQLNYIVTLTINNKFTTECLSIDNKNFPILDDYYDTELNEVYVPCDVEVLKLKEAAQKWHETDDIAIINFWYKNMDTAFMDENGNITF